MSGTTWVARKLKDFKSKALFWKETAIIEFTEQVVTAMRSRGLKRTDVAKEMGKSKAHVTQLLQGPNMTFGTAAELALAVGMRFRPVLEQVEPPIIAANESRSESATSLCVSEDWSEMMVLVCSSRPMDRVTCGGHYEFVGITAGPILGGHAKSVMQ